MALTLRFSFRARSNRVAGRLSFGANGGAAEHVREIIGSSCGEVVEALVLVALVLIEDAASNPAQVAEGLAPTLADAQRAARPSQITPAPQPPDAGGPRVQLLTAAAAAYVSGHLPRAAGRAQLGAGLELMSLAGSVLTSARLLAAFTGAGRGTTAGQRATFWSVTGRLELAAPRVAWRWLGADVYGLLELGRVHAVSHREGRDQTAHAQWLSAGGLTRIFASLPRRVRLELELGMFARLRAATFRFERADGSLAAIWRFPPFGVHAAIGVALLFS